MPRLLSASAPHFGRLHVLLSPGVIATSAGVILVVTTVLDRLLSPELVVLTGLLGLAPVLASAALRPRGTAVFASLAVLLALTSVSWNGVSAQFAVRILAVVLFGSLSVLVSAVRADREDELSASRRIAAVAQEALLPVLPERIDTIRIATRYHSATRSAQVGGDFFDFVHDARRTRFILGDVSGKGIDAVTQSARVIRAFRQYAASENHLLDVACRIHEYVRPFWDLDFYATAVLVEMLDERTVAVVSAGHPAPLLLSAGHVAELPVAASLPLGIGPADSVTQHDWEPRDRLLLYTDGLIEARDQHGTFLPRRSVDLALQTTGSLDVCLDALLDTVRCHSGKFGDDLALVLLQNGPSPARSSSALDFPSPVRPATHLGSPPAAPAA